MKKATVHMAPALGMSQTRCCFKTPQSLPIKDLVTLVPGLVTCGK